MSVSSSGVWIPPFVSLSCRRLGLRTSKEAVVVKDVRENGTVKATCNTNGHGFHMADLLMVQNKMESVFYGNPTTE